MRPGKLGQLPTSLEIQGTRYKIRSDYRNILRIFSALQSDLREREKSLVFLRRMYVDLPQIPLDAYGEAFEAANTFIERRAHSPVGVEARHSRLKIVDWEKDEQLIFAAVNHVAGQEVRALPYLHWWTFMGYFQSIDRDDLWATVLLIRQKKARGRRLEPYEREFYQANRALCDLRADVDRKQEAITHMDRLFDDLTTRQQ